MINNRPTDEWVLKSNTSSRHDSKTVSDGDCAGLHDLWQPDEKRPDDAGVSFEDRLCNHAEISNEQLDQARSIHNKTPRKRLGQILLEMGVVNESQLQMCLAEQYDLPFIHLERDMVDPEVVVKLDKNFIESHNVLPYGVEDGKLLLAMTDPANIFLQDEIRRKTGMALVIKVCVSSDIRSVLAGFDDNAAGYQMEDIIQDVHDEDVEVVSTEEEDLSDLERAAGDSPIIKFVNYVIMNAVKEGASDIHIEPGDKKLQVRYRIDGVLFSMISPPYGMYAAVVSRIKIMANLDISERRLPQDGRIRVMINGRNIDMRVSTLPSSYGEKVVIRILDSGSANVTLKDLGMEQDTHNILDHQIHRAHG